MAVHAENLDLLFRAWNIAFKDGLGQAPDDWTKVAMRVPVKTRTTEFGFLGKVPGLRRWLGDRVVNELTATRYAVTVERYESTIAVDADDLADDQHGIYTGQFAELGRAAAAHPNELVFGKLLSGWTEPGIDGAPFFSTDHPATGAAMPAQGGRGRKAGAANTDATGGDGPAWFLMDMSRAVKPLMFLEREMTVLKRRDRPTDDPVWRRREYQYGVDGRCAAAFGFWQLCWGSKQDLTKDNFNAAYQALLGMKGEHDRPLGIRPNLLVVPPNLRQQAREIPVAERDQSQSRRRRDFGLELVSRRMSAAADIEALRQARPDLVLPRLAVDDAPVDGAPVDEAAVARALADAHAIVAGWLARAGLPTGDAAPAFAATYALDIAAFRLASSAGEASDYATRLYKDALAALKHLADAAEAARARGRAPRPALQSDASGEAGAVLASGAARLFRRRDRRECGQREYSQREFGE